MAAGDLLEGPNHKNFPYRAPGPYRQVRWLVRLEPPLAPTPTTFGCGWSPGSVNPFQHTGTTRWIQPSWSVSLSSFTAPPRSRPQKPSREAQWRHGGLQSSTKVPATAHHMGHPRLRRRRVGLFVTQTLLVAAAGLLGAFLFLFGQPTGSWDRVTVPFYQAHIYSM